MPVYSKEKFPDEFEQAFVVLMKFEGEYSNNPQDSGGRTNYGISEKSYPLIDIKNLTLEKAKEIYFKDYWLKANCEKIINPDIAKRIFLFSVNSGIKQTAKTVQRALKASGRNDIDDDGIWGNKTIEALNAAPSNTIIAALRSEIAGYYRLISALNPTKNNIFIKGWLKRAYY